jgi:hypothetical protein
MQYLPFNLVGEWTGGSSVYPTRVRPRTGFGVLCSATSTPDPSRAIRAVSQRGGGESGPLVEQLGHGGPGHLAQTYPLLVMEGLVC